MKIRYHQPSKTKKEGTFTCANVEDEQCVLTESDAEGIFSQPLLKEAKMKSTRRKYFVSLPPGDVLSKKGMISMTNVPVAFKQYHQDICAWAGAASAMFHLDLHKQASAFFATCWSNDKGINWNPFLRNCKDVYQTMTLQ